MSHATAIRDRLPPLYRDGALIGQICALSGAAFDMIDEDARFVQQAHWFDRAFLLEDATKLAAVLDLGPESWQALLEFRGWVHALRNAMLQRGAVTVSALQRFLQEYAEAYRTATQSMVVGSLSLWEKERRNGRASFVENPPRIRSERAPTVGGTEPLAHWQVENRGLDPARLAVLMTGLPAGPECVPVVVNLTTHEAIVYRGTLGCGARLAITATADGGIRALLEGRDVSKDVCSVSPLVPGTPWEGSAVHMPARAITLARGVNDLWFLPLAHFDLEGLDRALLSLADLALAQGVFDTGRFDAALYHQDAAVRIDLQWTEHAPATIDIDLPGGAMLSPEGELAESLVERDRFATAINVAVDRLRAAGVTAAVTVAPLTETVGQLDRLTLVLPLQQREVAPVGRDRLPDVGGVYEVTSYDDSTFR